MVLVSNEWQNNKDDEQKPNAASTTTTTTTSASSTTTIAATAAAAAAVPTAAISNGVATGTATDQELTVRLGAVTSSHTGVELSKRQQRLNKKAQHKMELNNKAEQEQLLLREKHETETCELSTETINISINSNNTNDANDNLENQENNNTTVADICDSNTNTLQGHLAQQQHLQLAINSVLNTNNTTTSGNILSSMGALPLPHETATTLMNPQDMSPGEAKIMLHCEGKSHKFETRTILLAANQECKVGRLIAKSKASEGNAIFDCKVLSRNHAMLWYTPDNHFWVRDTKSSNGTFINDNKLGNDPAELHYGDTVKFGVEVIENSRQEVHGCIIARVTLFLPDGREAISIDSEQVQLAGPNRISYDEIQRLNAFLQEASQREKMLKAKLSNLQGVLDSTRKNSAMCWQSMITEDQLLHKINLLEKKLQMLEKNVPENALRNEIVKLLEDKTTYQLTAKEALRKVYQDRCDAMQMLSKMEMAYTTSDNECSILRAQILSSKQTLQDFNARLEQLQQEYAEYKQETLHQQQEAKELEEVRVGQLRDQLSTQQDEADQMRQQLNLVQQTITEQKQHALQQQALEQLNAAIGDEDDDDDDDDDENDNDEDKEFGDQENGAANNEDHDLDKDKLPSESSEQLEKEQNTVPSKEKSKKSKRQQKDEFNLKNKVVRKDTMLKWLKNSDLNKGADGGDILKAIFNNDDSGDDDLEQKSQSLEASPTSELSAGIKQEALAETASDEFIHKSPKHTTCLNGIEELADDLPIATHKLESQGTLVKSEDAEILPEHAVDMLEEECQFYKQKSASLSSDIIALEDEMRTLKKQLQDQLSGMASGAEQTDKAADLSFDEQEQLLSDAAKENTELLGWREELNTINNAEVEREEELIVYKERLEQSEVKNMQLRNEINQLRLKQPMAYDNQLFYRRALPLGFVALAAIIYFFSIRF